MKANLIAPRRVAACLGMVVWVSTGCGGVTGGTAQPAEDTEESTPGRAASPTTTAPTTSMSVAPMAIEDYLLGRAELAEIVGDTDMAPIQTYTAPDPMPAPINPRDCADRALPASASGYSALSREAMVGEANRGARGQSAAQVITAFENPEDPERLVSTARTEWQSCPTGQVFTIVSGNDVGHWVAGPITAEQFRIAATIERQEPPPRSCHHVLAAQTNIVVETLVCGDGDTAGQANEIANRILGELPG